VDIAPDIPLFKSDRGKLEQIFLNLMNNAFAALSDGGRLQIIGRKKSEEDLNISVIDDGCGIHPDDIKRVFEPFFSTRTKPAERVLGFPLLTVWCRSSGEPSRWRVNWAKEPGLTLPCRCALMRRKWREMKPIRILLADDEEELVVTLAERLEIRGFVVEWVTTVARRPATSCGTMFLTWPY
jgi:light-regulated signal transduction histidine kinase (bacteriophytochrome)